MTELTSKSKKYRSLKFFLTNKQEIPVGEMLIIHYLYSHIDKLIRILIN